MKEYEINEEYLKSLARETTYYWNDTDECFIKSVPGKGFFVKFPERLEYAVNGTPNIVLTGVLSGHKVSKGEYDDERLIEQ